MGRLGRGEQSVWEEQNASELCIQVPISEAERLESSIDPLPLKQAQNDA